MTDVWKTKKPRRHFGGWISLKSTAHTRVTESSALILFLIHRDRQMEFNRWKFMLDKAIEKVDQMAKDTDQPFLIHKRNFILSAKQLMEQFRTNINYNNPNLPVVSFVTHTKELMVNVMKNCEKELAPKSSDSIAMSSDSESESVDPEFHYREVIEDYVKSSSIGSKGRFQKQLSKKLTDRQIHPLTLNLIPYSTVYRELETEFSSKIVSGSVHTYPMNKARHVFCLSAQKLLRIGNSSSVIERAFSDSLRSVAGRRNCLSLENIKHETFLRSLTKQILKLKSLAEHLNYDSDTFQLMLSLHEEVSMEEKIKK